MFYVRTTVFFLWVPVPCAVVLVSLSATSCVSCFYGQPPEMEFFDISLTENSSLPLQKTRDTKNLFVERKNEGWKRDKNSNLRRIKFKPRKLKNSISVYMLCSSFSFIISDISVCSFVRGVVDSDDLPLNVSRENLQQHKLLKVPYDLLSAT
jgi:hypothetical protein